MPHPTGHAHGRSYSTGCIVGRSYLEPYTTRTTKYLIPALHDLGETAHWLEWQDWADPILEEPFRLDNGQLQVSDRPGVGLKWNEPAVKAHEVRS